MSADAEILDAYFGCIVFHLLMPLKKLLWSWKRKIVCSREETRKDTKIVKKLHYVENKFFYNRKVLEHPYVKILIQSTNDDGCFQNFKFNYVENAKVIICNNVVKWID